MTSTANESMPAKATPSDHTETVEEHESANSIHPSESGSQITSPVVDDDTWSIADSGLGGLSSDGSSTSSLRSSVYEVETVNGRTYHGFKQGKYLLPNDEAEQDRLNLQHVLFGITLHGKLNLAPIEEESLLNVLDIATGTGLWATEFADQHPQAKVVGTDLSAIQPLYVPANCSFEIDDAEDEWVFGNRFDYIHGRALATCFKDPSFVIRQAFNALEPGGYFEFQDFVIPFDFLGPPPTESSLYKWGHLIVEGGSKSGRPWNNVQHYKRWLEEAGFEEVVEKRFFWPTSPWAKGDYFKTIAAYAQADLLMGLEGISLKSLGQLGWDADKIKEFLVGVREDVQNTKIHCYVPGRVVYGRKPKIPVERKLEPLELS